VSFDIVLCTNGTPARAAACASAVSAWWQNRPFNPVGATTRGSAASRPSSRVARLRPATSTSWRGVKRQSA
jgi:hypothetical protein